MASRNEFTIWGRVTKDPVLRKTPGGIPTVTFVVAVNDNFPNGRKNPTCDFIPVTSYGDQAEKDVAMLKKGDDVGVKGTIRSWYDEKSGKGGFNFEIEEGGVLHLGRAVRPDAATPSKP